MIKEKSCGAVVYRMNGDKLEILVIHQNKGFWSIPKGHVQGHETEVETAYREILEETGLKVDIDSHFRYVVTYSPKNGVLKDVVLFIGKVIGGSIKPQETEVNEVLWVDYRESLNLVTYDDIKVVLERAFEYLENKKNIGD